MEVHKNMVFTFTKAKSIENVTLLFSTELMVNFHNFYHTGEWVNTILANCIWSEQQENILKDMKELSWKEIFH